MKMKKLLAAAMAATMILSSMVTSFVASAATVGKITAGDVTVCPGKESTVNVDVEINFDGEGVKAPHNIVSVAIAGYDLKEVTDIATVKTGEGDVIIDEDGSNLAAGKILFEAPVDSKAPTVTKITFTAVFEENGEAKGTEIVVNGDDMTDVNEAEIGIDAKAGVLTIAHAYEASVTAPTCTAQGFTTHTCACGDTYIDTYVDPIAHSYVDGKCTVCGADDPNYEPPVTGPVLDETIVFNGEKMQFSNTINALLRINKALVNSYASLEVIVVPTVYNAGNETVGEEIVIPVTSGTSKNWNVYYEGIGMYAMALTFDAYVKCYDAEGNYVAYSNVSTYSPIDLIKGVYVAGSTDATQKKLNSLVTDTLNLATKAQVYFANQSQYAGSDLAADVAAGNVANKDWPQDCATTAYAELNTVNSIEYIAPFTSTDSKLSFLSDLNGAPVFTCKFSKYQTAFPDLSKLKLELSYTEVYGESSVVTDTIEGDEWQIAGKSVVAPASLVALYDGNKTVTGVLTYDGVEVIRFNYSLESYISENIGSTDANFVNLLNAIAYFNVSSRAYFGTN